MNPRRPTPRDLESRPFDLARAPPLSVPYTVFELFSVFSFEGDAA